MTIVTAMQPLPPGVHVEGSWVKKYPYNGRPYYEQVPAARLAVFAMIQSNGACFRRAPERNTLTDTPRNTV